MAARTRLVDVSHIDSPFHRYPDGSDLFCRSSQCAAEVVYNAIRLHWRERLHGYD